jgi:hypothetical protein
MEAEGHFLAASMDDRFVVASDQQFPKLADIPHCEWVDGHKPVRRGNLEQTEHRPIGMLRHELGVEGDGRSGFEMPAKSLELSLSGDER